ncbi:MAG TPA: transposase [Candidatus Babeliales bacterium]|nr:transposase [Candidatus Babeliales bacterium]
MEETYTNAVLMNLFILFGQCDRIITRTCRNFNEMYPNLPPMNLKKFIRIQNNFTEFGSALKAPRNLPRPVTSNEDNEINVLAYFQVFPQSSIRCAQDDLGITYSSVQRILVKHNMHDYKFTKVQAMKPQDPQHRVEFCEMLLVRTQEDPNFLNKIIWTDESKFSREGIFNRRNSHFWASENPHVTKEAGFQEKFSFNVFCMLMDNQLHYVIYEESLNSRNYVNILRTDVENFVDNMPLEDYRSCWYQLDGAPAHCTREVSAELDRIFDDRWIRRLGPWNWPPRSPDLNPLDFYLWGMFKEKVYKSPVNSKEELLLRVTQEFRNLDPTEIRSATTNAVNTRILKCLDVNGQRFEHLLK